MSWFGDFWDALPDALEGFYRFGDPGGIGNGWWGIVILLIWGILLTAVPLFIAKQTYGKHEWVSATMGVVGGLAIFWWLYGILPSAWIYYLDSNQEVLRGAIIPGSIGIEFANGFLWFPEGYRLDIASNFYEVIRDLVVVIEHLVAFIVTFWAAIKIQKKYPKSLVPGEVKPDSGGYK